jgi:ribonuclease HI
MNHHTQSPILIYTDGGCSGNPGPGAWAYIILLPGKQVNGSAGTDHTTNNRMELTAVIKALEYVNFEDHLQKMNIQVVTDSEYVKNGITKWIHNWVNNGWKTSSKKAVKNRDLWQSLEKAASNFEIQWNWVKGHSGDKYNELCDQLVQNEIKKIILQ